MKISFYRPLLIAGLSIAMAACGSGSPAIVATPIENIDQLPLKITPLTDPQIRTWSETDLTTDTIPGMSVKKAYEEIIKNRKGKSVIVAVIDSGVDVEHEDLQGNIWINSGEIPGNGIDDDKNGYVDDVHGWNFLGDAVKENLEFTRIYKRYRSRFEGKPASAISTADMDTYKLYQRAKEELEKEYEEALSTKNQYEQIRQQLREVHEAVSEKLGKEDYSKKELGEMLATTSQMRQYKLMLLQIQENVNENIPQALKELEEAIEYFTDRLNYHLNPEFDGRSVVGDDPYDITDTDYGNPKVSGPSEDKEDTKHGTHVAGIIGAMRNNDIGINGVANNPRIMVLRAVPDGDEYDKDIALAIRYAVDNGASVINTSFGKYFSQYPGWLNEAIKYADKNDVLIVNAAGNDGIDLDEKAVYPNDQQPDQPEEFVNNFLTVGALNYEYGSGLVAGFSNYGKRSVDVFAPGTKIWSTVPNDDYEYLQGTSMAAPQVAGIAALLRSFFPDLSAPQIKKIIMDSGVSTNASVNVGEEQQVKKFTELSRSGKMANLFNALILADKVSKQ